MGGSALCFSIPGRDESVYVSKARILGRDGEGFYRVWVCRHEPHHGFFGKTMRWVGKRKVFKLVDD